MSDRHLLALLLGLAAFAAPLRAQERERLARREAELTSLLARLEADQTSTDSARFVDQRRTIVSAGNFHVAYPEWAATEARSRLPELMAARRHRYGIAVDSLLTDTLYIWVDDSEQTDDRPWSALQWRMGSLQGEGSIAGGEGASADWVEWVAAAAMEKWAQSIIDPEFTRWLGSMSPRTDQRDLRDGAVRELILAPSSRARRCLDGMLDDCQLLLELAVVPDPLLQAYDPSDYHGIVERIGSRSPSGRARCLNGRDLATCAEILQRQGNRPLRAVSGRVRQSLLSLAVVRGGEDAWLRLSRAAGRPVGDQLAAVAGIPLDSLLAGWRNDLLDDRRTTEAGLGTAFLMALAWSVVGSLLFAWRYRWRHV